MASERETRKANGYPTTQHNSQSNSRANIRKLERDIHGQSEAHDVFTLISSHPETNPTPKKKSSQTVQPWIRTQQATFTKWVNNHIKDTGREVTDLQDDLKDGLVLIKLMEILTDRNVQVRYQRNPRTHLQRLENMRIAFDFMEESNVELVSMRPLDIVDGNLKLILGLLWTLISKYQIATTHSGISPKGSTPRKILLRWFQAVLQNKQVKNFRTDWNDGTNLSALVDYCRPGLIPDHASLDPNNGLENVTNAMQLAEDNFSIPQVILPQDLASEHPDELSVMTYLSFFCCQGSPGQAVLLQWINSVIPDQLITNFSFDWKDGEALCALVRVFSPHALPSSQETALANVKAAMAVASNQLGVEQTLTPEEFVHLDLDQTSMMAYLTQFKFLDRMPPESSPPAVEGPQVANTDTPLTAEGPEVAVTDLALFSEGPGVADPDTPPLSSEDSGADDTPPLSAEGPGVSGGTAGADKPFSIKGSVHSEAELTIAITSPKGSVVDFDKVPSPTGEPTYQYTPEVPGTYVIDVTYSGEHISGSPYIVTHTASFHPQNCSVDDTGLRRVCVGRTAKFTVDASKAGVGKLEVEVHNPNSAEVPVSIAAKDRGLYEVCFTTREVGEHWVFVSWGSEDVPSSPFTCKVIDPFSCVASGDGLSGGVLGHPSRFEVATAGAGPGKLSATVYGPSEPVDLTQQPKKNGTYSYTYTPQQSGSYIIEIKWEGFPVPGSPFTAHPSSEGTDGGCFVKKMHTGLTRVNKTVSVLVDSSAVPGSILNATVCGPTSEDECEVVKVEDGVYGVMFTPKAVGKYSVNILCNGTPIPDSPLHFSVNDPSKCKVDVYYGSFQVDTPITFQVSTSKAGEGELTATVKGPNSDQDCTITKGSNGKYNISFTPHIPETYVADLFFDGDPFLASPLEFHVCVKEERCVFEAIEREEEAPLGELVDYFLKKENEKEEDIIVTKPESNNGFYLLDDVHEFHMLAPGRKPEEFNVSAIGVKTRCIPSVTLVPTDDHTYTIQFMATERDDYTVEIMYEGTHVRGSPFTLKLRPAANADKVQAFDPVKPFKANGNPIQLLFDASQAGMGSLVANVISSEGKQLQTSMEETLPDMYRVTFVPTQSDQYSATIMWDGKPVKGSPFTVNYREQTAEPAISIGFEPDMIDGVKGQLAARCNGQNTGGVDLQVQQFETGHYQLSFDPPGKDLYRLEVYWFGKEIDGSPFEINLTDTPSSGEEHLVRSLTVEREGQSGVLSACVLGSKSGVVPINLSLSQNKERLQILFYDRLKETFDLFIFWNHQLLNGAPFKLDHNASVHATQPSDSLRLI